MASVQGLAAEAACRPRFDELLEHTPLAEREIAQLRADVIQRNPLRYVRDFPDISARDVARYADLIDQHFFQMAVRSHYATGITFNFSSGSMVLGQVHDPIKHVTSEEQSRWADLNIDDDFYVLDINYIPFIFMRSGARMIANGTPVSNYEDLLFSIVAHELVHILIMDKCHEGRVIPPHGNLFQEIVFRLFHHTEYTCSVDYYTLAGGGSGLVPQVKPDVDTLRRELEPLTGHLVCYVKYGHVHAKVLRSVSPRYIVRPDAHYALLFEHEPDPIRIEDLCFTHAGRIVHVEMPKGSYLERAYIARDLVTCQQRAFLVLGNTIGDQLSAIYTFLPPDSPEVGEARMFIEALAMVMGYFDRDAGEVLRSRNGRIVDVLKMELPNMSLTEAYVLAFFNIDRAIDAAVRAEGCEDNPEILKFVEKFKQVMVDVPSEEIGRAWRDRYTDQFRHLYNANVRGV